MAKKRANGEGNIRKRKDGRWEGRYTAGHDPETGKAIYKNVLGRTQAEAKAKLKAAIEETKVLLFHGMRCMVGGQQIDGAVSYGCDGCLAILFGAQRRIHLGESAVFQQCFIAQRNVVRCSFARDR